ncbi:hypothetical protein CWC29_012080 [Pseudoalteromonas sp. S4498]|uniref:hypothetical protein n=1 Tax=Pseudoalteromonas TaxID=53246 RepID=UPI001108DF39|nr:MULTISPECIES: hypothetical protein [Pseudoalteromonas]MCG9759137.1 hypothetical protein [Pseudoalteromonas sp. Isolate6]NKC19571.1 hypothetical protein [Pseudoalteromonas galatheae]
MDKRIEPELPSITPDLDQVEAFKDSLNQANNKVSTSNTSSKSKAIKTQKTGVINWISIAAIIALAASVFGLYGQLSATQTQLLESTKRIAELEHTLTATDEEMDLSAGAMQAKLNTLTERTDELWSQMDKLWASAWRRNQSEIKKLEEQASNNAKSQTSTTTRVEALSQSQTELALKLSLIEEQQQAANVLKNQIAAINDDVDQLKSQTQSRDSKQIEIGGSLAQIEMTQTALAEKLERLERRLAAATVTQPSTN